MKTTKIFTALSSFNLYELNRFKKFIDSPYFNVNQNLVLLFDEINNFLRNDIDKELNKEEIWDRIYPELAYNDLKFRKLNSDLLKLLEKYILHEQFSEHEMLKSNLLIEGIREKRLNKIFKTTIEKSRQLAKRRIDLSAENYYHSYQIEKSIFNLNTDFERKSSSKRGLYNFNIIEINKNLDNFYFIEKLKYYCTLLSWKQFQDNSEEIPLINDVISILKDRTSEFEPQVLVYYKIYLTLTESDVESHYFELRDLIKKYIEEFPLSEAKDIYDSAFNYCIRKVNQGKINFQEELLELYFESLDNGKILQNGELSPTSLRNIVFLGLRLGKFDLTEKMIKKYSKYINENYRNNAITFNQARLHFYRKEYDQVILLLREVEYEDIVYNLNSKTILLATYYETEEIDALESLIQSFTAFLNRTKKVPQVRKGHYLRLLRYTNKLIKIYPGQFEKLDKLKKEIENSAGIVNKAWLLQKIEELEKKRSF